MSAIKIQDLLDKACEEKTITTENGFTFTYTPIQFLSQINVNGIPIYDSNNMLHQLQVAKLIDEKRSCSKDKK